MKFLSVCSGIEAASVAWGPLGWEAVAFSEIAAFPSRVLAHRFPRIPNLGDMHAHESWNLDPIDILVGGTPCQSFSVAGLRGGMADARGNLALVYLEIARRLRPRWVVWENVPGVLSADGGAAFGSILGGLAELGYGWAYRVLDAQHFGVPQRRRRVFVVGCLGDWRGAAAVLFERACLRGNPAPSREAWQSPAGTIGARSCRSVGADDAANGHMIARSLRGQAQPSHREDSDNYVTHALRADGFDASEDGTGRGTPLIAFPCKDHGQDVGDVAPTLRSMNGSHANAGGQAAVAFQEAQTGVRGYANAGSLRANGPGHDPVGTRVRSGMAVRRLTPLECERLQGFPDGWTDIPGAKDGPRYKAIGNSKAVPVVRWIGERIALVDALANGASARGAA